jgi:ubiquinone/menaquinone biosynthesis C-methylase UbiE
MTEKETEIIEKYNYLTEDDGIFMNDGFTPLNAYRLPTDFIDLNLTKKYKQWKYQVYMYRFLLNRINIRPVNSKNKSILDVGCGRGGGLSFYKDYYNFSRLVGVDLNPNHIKICKNHTEGVEFIESSATNMPLENNSFDIITAVETSPYYEPFEDYVKEIHRLLKDDGVYVRAERYIQEPDDFLSAGFKEKFTIDITPNVRMACSISKWAMLNVSDRISNVFFNDEQEYINNNAFYNVRAYVKI